jgi:lipid II:glycine glycyltransferase (peptidoglycan interpeptide bridge formation enzyme)
MSIVTPGEWEQFLERFPEHHFLQSSAWGKLKSDFGWEAVHLVCEEMGSQILFRKLPLGFHIAYIPKGPVFEQGTSYPAEWERFWKEVDQLCQERRAAFIKVELDIWVQRSPLQDTYPMTAAPPALIIPGAAQPPVGFEVSAQTVQPAQTLVIDITGSEEQILARMKQKTRYNIRLAQRRGVRVHASDDIALFSRLMKETGERDSFGVHTEAYYQRAYDLLCDRASILIAELESEPIAALFAICQGHRSYYLYGASANKHRDAMPTYLIQWEAMRWARQQGCSEYDLWGVPDGDAATLEAEFTQRADGLWGVYRFKRGFGGELRRSAGAWDRVYYRWLYALYRRRAG